MGVSWPSTHLQGRYGLRLELDHYLELLWRKPGALSRSLPLQQARSRGEWPAAYDQLFAALHARFEPSEAARQMLAVLMLHRQTSAEEVHVAVSLALEYGSFDAGAIAVVLNQLRGDDVVASPLDALGALHRYDRPTLGTGEYDQLLVTRAGKAVH